MDIRPIQKQSMSDQVCDQIKQLLLDGTWKPGEKIPSESDLCTAFGVSRVTIREAVLKLTAMGLLESKFAGGTYVKEIKMGLCMNSIIPVAYLGTDSILEVLTFRQVIEIRTAGLAARLASEEDVKRLEDLYAHMLKTRDNKQEFSAADLEFHMEIARISKNSLIIQTMEIIKDILSEAIYNSVFIRGDEGGIRDHGQLIEAVKAHDEQKAMDIMEAHLKDIVRTFEAGMNDTKN